MEWRDKAVHRATPLVLPRLLSDVEPPLTREDFVIGMQLAPEFAFNYEWPIRPGKVVWQHPLYFQRRWRERLVVLCGEVCADIVELT